MAGQGVQSVALASTAMSAISGAWLIVFKLFLPYLIRLEGMPGFSAGLYLEFAVCKAGDVELSMGDILSHDESVVVGRAFGFSQPMQLENCHSPQSW